MTRICIALALTTISAIAQARAIPHDVYVWQRQWTPALRTALVESRDTFDGVRVLLAQAGRNARWATTDADPRALANDPRTRVGVVRYDGSGSAPDVAALSAFLIERIDHWRAAGAPLSGIEVDYDAGSSRLDDYAARLRALRSVLPANVAISITALPTWLDHAALDDVIAAVDEPVLQVHSVDDPKRGLFDRATAERRIRAFAPHAPRGFRIALPAYGSRVAFDANGRPVAVENEMKRDIGATDDTRELAVDPAEVVALLQALERDPPPNWRGVAWFRLPVFGDRRAWTLDAMRDVIAGRVPQARMSVEIRSREGGASDIVVVNEGVADANAAALIVTATGCSAGDASDGWRAEAVRDGWRFVPETALRIRARTRRAVGWVRCTELVGARVE